MPRSPAAGPSPSAHLPPNYFDSLQELADYTVSPGKRTRSGPAPPRKETSTKTQGKLVVCHDYKGGYYEKEFEREYAFQWWHLTDTFIYFSHHRVSLPPPDWIRTAHRHGTRILGTLIFEWDAGRADVIELVEPGATQDSAKIDKVDLRYVDRLVDLAEERGFDGWLINVEVELGGPREAGGARRGAKQHAEALLVWLVHLRKEMHRRIPGSEVMWYDAVTFPKGHLSWQNAVTEQNLPFFAACDSIFLNYFWNPSRIESTSKLLDRFQHLDKTNVFFGIDVYGRGSYGGGGFEIWRALEAVVPSAKTTSGDAKSSTFSTALFAPGWTVESSDLKHSLDTREGYDRWFADEAYLWANGPETASVPLELARMRKLRREQAGQHRARQLAQALHRSSVPYKFRPPIEPLDFDLSSLPDPPGTFRSICGFIDAPRPIPSDGDYDLDSTFYTNFASGSGLSFWVDGNEACRSERGWTDIDCTFPFPSLAFHRRIEGFTFAMIEDDVWQGNRSLRIVKHVDGSRFVPLIPVELPTRKDCSYTIVSVWKPLDDKQDLTLQPCVVSESYPSLFPSTSISQVRTSVLNDKWRRSAINYTSPESAVISQIGINVSSAAETTILVGSIAFFPCLSPSTPRPVLSKLHYSDSASSLEWNVDYSIPSNFGDVSSPSPSSSLSPHLPPIVQFHIYRNTSSARNPKQGEEEYLGTTRFNDFAIEKSIIEGSTIIVRGALFDESVVETSLSIPYLSSS